MRAADLASQIAKNNQAELTILHVMTISSAAYSGEAPYPFNKIEKVAWRDGERFVATAASLAERNGIKAKTAITTQVDSAMKGITQYANENKIDLIVVGTRDLGSFKRVLLGSTATGLVHSAHCSVLVVK